MREGRSETAPARCPAPMWAMSQPAVQRVLSRGVGSPSSPLLTGRERLHTLCHHYTREAKRNFITSGPQPCNGTWKASLDNTIILLLGLPCCGMCKRHRGYKANKLAKGLLGEDLKMPIHVVHTVCTWLHMHHIFASVYIDTRMVCVDLLSVYTHAYIAWKFRKENST